MAKQRPVAADPEQLAVLRDELRGVVREAHEALKAGRALLAEFAQVDRDIHTLLGRDLRGRVERIILESSDDMGRAFREVREREARFLIQAHEGARADLEAFAESVMGFGTPEAAMEFITRKMVEAFTDMIGKMRLDGLPPDMMVDLLREGLIKPGVCRHDPDDPEHAKCLPAQIKDADMIYRGSSWAGAPHPPLRVTATD
jgi:hypothetical protein